jgi:hypothetical protein
VAGAIRRLLREHPIREDSCHRHRCPHISAAAADTHPAGCGSFVWSSIIAALSEAHRTYALDTIGGLGRSRFDDHDRYPKTGRDYSAWLDDVSAELGIGSSDVVAECGGRDGWAGLQRGRRRPKLRESRGGHHDSDPCDRHGHGHRQSRAARANAAAGTEGVRGTGSLRRQRCSWKDVVGSRAAGSHRWSGGPAARRMTSPKCGRSRPRHTYLSAKSAGRYSRPESLSSELGLRPVAARFQGQLLPHDDGLPPHAPERTRRTARQTASRATHASSPVGFGLGDELARRAALRGARLVSAASNATLTP